MSNILHSLSNEPNTGDNRCFILVLQRFGLCYKTINLCSTSAMCKKKLTTYSPAIYVYIYI